MGKRKKGGEEAISCGSSSRKETSGIKTHIEQLEAKRWKDDCAVSAADECRGYLLARNAVCGDDRRDAHVYRWRTVF